MSWRREDSYWKARYSKSSTSSISANDDEGWSDEAMTAYDDKMRAITAGSVRATSATNSARNYDGDSWADNPSEDRIVKHSRRQLTDDEDEDDGNFLATRIKKMLPKALEWFPKLEGEAAVKYKAKKKSLKQNWCKGEKQIKRNFVNGNLTRPQLMYKDFARRIRVINLDKFDFSSHPSAHKIRAWVPSEPMLTYKESDLFTTKGQKPTWITEEDELRELCVKLNTCTEIALDAERHNIDTRQGFIALIQIATWEFGEFIIDPISLQKPVQIYLKKILESTDILKIVHGGSNDIVHFQQSSGIFMAGCIDTQILYKKVNGGDPIGYEAMCTAFFPKYSKDLENIQTNSDWRLRPSTGMTEAQLQYAVNDVYYLLRAFNKMKMIISKKGQQGSQILAEAVEDCNVMALKVYKNPARQQVSYSQLAEEALAQLRTKTVHWKLLKAMVADQIELFTLLVEWRHRLGKIIDRKDQDVLSDVSLLHLAYHEPMNENDVKLTLKEDGMQLQTACRQFKVLANLIKGRTSYAEKLRNLICHNCLKSGHGPAFACPAPKDPHNKRVYYNQPDKVDLKRKMRSRYKRSKWEREQKAKETKL